MDGKNRSNRYLVIHTHFYQPPRENPYTGEIDLDYTSKPYDNWNHRIAMESYFPNLYSRIHDHKGDIIEIINNCDYLNLDYGPTLLCWIEEKYPNYYSRIKETFARNKEKTFNFMAQGYNHTILPLDSFLDKIVQVNWGIKDFEFRFGTKPKGMWLGECAVNEEVLKVLIDSSIEYIILAPHQILKAYDPQTKKDLEILPNRIYRWYDKTEDGKLIPSRFIDIITYDNIISKKIAFNNITFNSEIFIKELNYRYSEINFNTLVIACDGETFGHHQKFADLTLAHAFKHELPKYNIEVISAYQYIKKTPVYAVCELNTGPDGLGTSWSCEHGIRRWMGGCPCGDEGKYSTEWRKPLRVAVNWLSEVINDIITEEGKALFKDYLLALINYIDVVNKKLPLEDFLNIYVKSDSKEAKYKALKLLEMFRFKALSRTSCGWFFNDISRIETQIIIRYAMKASQLAQDLGYKGVEKGFLSFIENSISNFHELKNGRFIYENFIRKTEMDDEKSSIFLSIKAAFLNQKKYSNKIWEVNINESNISDNHIYLKSTVIKNEYIKFDIKINMDMTHMENIKIHVEINAKTIELSIFDFSPNAQIEMLKLILNLLKETNTFEIEKTLMSLIEIAIIYPSMAQENLYDDINYYLKSYIESCLIKFIKTQDYSLITGIKSIIEKAEKISFKINFQPSNNLLLLTPEFVKKMFEDEFTLSQIEEINYIFKKLSLHHFYFHTQNYLYTLKVDLKN